MTDTRRLGSAGPEITTVGLGTWAVGGPWKFGWGVQDDDESLGAIRRALELGINWIDTAWIYGFGHSEQVVGRAIAGIPRDSVIVATKCGRARTEDDGACGDLRPASIREQALESLRNLGTDYIDLFQIHWPDLDTGTPIEESWQAMAALQDEGLTRWIGVSNFDTGLLDRCEAIRHVDSLQPPYSLLKRDAEAALLPWCEAHGTGVVVYSPMQAGLLTGAFDMARVAEDDWRRRNPLFEEPRLAQNLAFVERLRPIAARTGHTVGHLAVAWTLRQPAITAAIVGARRASQADENARGLGYRLTEADLAEIDAALAELAAAS